MIRLGYLFPAASAAFLLSACGGGGSGGGGQKELSGWKANYQPSQGKTSDIEIIELEMR